MGPFSMMELSSALPAVVRKGVLACTMGLALGLSAAQATVTVTPGNNPQPGQENILLNSGITGNPIFGTTNQSGLSVRFTGTENLTAPASGQARIEAADGSLNSLQIDMAAAGTGFESLILNPDASADGTATITANWFNQVTGIFGQTVFAGLALSGSGNNFFTITTDAIQTLVSVLIETTLPVTFTDIAQFRISGAGTPLNVIPVPPAALLFMTGLAGLGLLARRRRKATEAIAS